jgi:hypothetical protein
MAFKKKPQLESPTPRTVKWLKELKTWTIKLTAWGTKIAKRVGQQEQRIKDLEARVAELEACCGVTPKKGTKVAMLKKLAGENDPPPPPKDWP